MAATALIFVRHAMPEVTPGLASALWSLAESSREDCVLLSHALPSGVSGPVCSSGQRKAAETAAIIALRRGLETAVDERLREVDQPPEWYEGDYRALAAGYLRGDGPPGWEARDAVVERFAGAVRDALAGASGDVVLVNHGLAMSLYLASRAPMVRSGEAKAPFDLVAFWRELTFPDAWQLNLESNQVTRVFGGGVSAE